MWPPVPDLSELLRRPRACAPPLPCLPVLQTNNELEAQRVATEFAFRKRLREMEKVYSELRWQEKNVSLLRLGPGRGVPPVPGAPTGGPGGGAPRWVRRVGTSRSVPADLGGDRRAAGGHPAPGGGSAQKATEPEALPYPAGVQNLPAQCGALPGPGTRVPPWGMGPPLRLPQDHTPPPAHIPGRAGVLVEGRIQAPTLTWASQPTPPPLGAVWPH